MDEEREDRDSAKRTGLRLSTGIWVEPGKSVEKGRWDGILGGKRQNTE